LEGVSLDVWLLKPKFIVQRLFIGPEKSAFRQEDRNEETFLSEVINVHLVRSTDLRFSVELLPYLGVWIWSTRQSLVFALVPLSYQKDYWLPSFCLLGRYLQTKTITQINTEKIL